MTRYRQVYKRKGVPKGYVHNWKYTGHWKEKKLGKKWLIDFRATKRRSGGRGGLPIGSKVIWGINGFQVARKTGHRVYQTRLSGKKRLVATYIKGRYKRY